MNENKDEPTLPQMVERYRRMMREGQGLVETMHRDAITSHRNPHQDGGLFVEQARRQVIEAVPAPPAESSEAQAVHFTELPRAQAGSRLSREWDFYRHEVHRLLAEGHEGRFVLIKGETIIGIWDSQEEAKAVAFTNIRSSHTWFTRSGARSRCYVVEPDLSVMEFTATLPQRIEAPIGLDVLRKCRLTVDGPGNWFSLDF